MLGSTARSLGLEDTGSCFGRGKSSYVGITNGKGVGGGSANDVALVAGTPFKKHLRSLFNLRF